MRQGEEVVGSGSSETGKEHLRRMAMPKSVTVICRNIRSCIAWKESICNIIDNLSVRSLTINQLRPGDGYYDDLIVIFPPSLKQAVMPCLDPQAKVIVAKKTLPLDKIYLLTHVPAGSDVVVLNDTYEYSLDIRDELRSLGFDQFKYHPYNFGEMVGRMFKYAVTCGEGSLMPEVDYCIDFGSRQVSISTVAEILNHFDMGDHLDEYILHRYVLPLNNKSIAFYQETMKSEALRRQLEASISVFDEGIILFNERLEILSNNTKAESILGDWLDSGSVKSLLSPKWDRKSDMDFFTQKGNVPLHISLKSLSLTDEKIFMATVTDIASLRDIEEKYKRHQTSSGLCAHYSFKDIYYQSDIMSQVVSTAKKYARSDSNILIIGESGVGKELFAQAIHNASSRKNGPFVAINCGALSSSLLESELFGYGEGAFTGALKGGKRGLFEVAHKGTLFLDEITDAPLPVQQKLLRAIQEGDIFRVSGTRKIHVNVRIIAATNRDIISDVKRGDFRHDLFYRIGVLTLRIPPLRDRIEDVFYLFKFLLNLSLKKRGIRFPEEQMTTQLERLLKKHNWPGNTREITNLVEVVTNGLELEAPYNIGREIQRYWDMLYHQTEPDPFSAKAVSCDRCGDKVELDEMAVQVLVILSILEKDGKAPGRSAIYRYCQGRGIPLSEQQIRLRINRLRREGLIAPAPGYGNAITEAGRRYLGNISADIDR